MGPNRVWPAPLAGKRGIESVGLDDTYTTVVRAAGSAHFASPGLCTEGQA